MLNSVVQKHRMHRFANRIISPKGKTDITHPATNFGSGKVFLDPFGGLEEVNGVGFMFIHSSRYRKDIGIKNNVVPVEPYFLSQDIITSFTYFAPSLIGIALPFLVQCHDDNRRPKALDHLGLMDEVLFSILQTDRIDDPLPLHALQAPQND